jgi:hypothetical protein
MGGQDQRAEPHDDRSSIGGVVPGVKGKVQSRTEDSAGVIEGSGLGVACDARRAERPSSIIMKT